MTDTLAISRNSTCAAIALVPYVKVMGRSGVLLKLQALGSKALAKLVITHLSFAGMMDIVRGFIHTTTLDRSAPALIVPLSE